MITPTEKSAFHTKILEISTIEHIFFCYLILSPSEKVYDLRVAYLCVICFFFCIFCERVNPYLQKAAITQKIHSFLGKTLIDFTIFYFFFLKISTSRDHDCPLLLVDALNTRYVHFNGFNGILLCWIYNIYYHSASTVLHLEMNLP